MKRSCLLLIVCTLLAVRQHATLSAVSAGPLLRRRLNHRQPRSDRFHLTAPCQQLLAAETGEMQQPNSDNHAQKICVS